MNEKLTEERNELFDSAVREKMTGYEPQVPHALWNRISSELDMGEASEETSPIAEHHEATISRRWKMSIAAAVMLTLGLGTLLYNLHSTGVLPSGTAPVANATKVNTKTVSQPFTTPVQVIETKTIAQSTTAVKKAVKINTTAPSHTAVKTEAESIAARVNTPIDNTPKQDAPNTDLEFAAVTTENKPVDLGTIPLAALNIQRSSSNLNDEITVIKSVEKKKKHGKKDDESTKVIVIGKKFETKPDIRYQIPVRF